MIYDLTYINHQYHTVAKIYVLDTGKFEQWQFWIQQYLQHEHYALWEVIEFGDSYKVPATVDPNDTNTTSGADAKSGRAVTITTDDMQTKKNDVKARTTLLLSLPDEHHGADAKSGRTVTITTEDMKRKKNDVKARTTLLLSLPDEHQNDLDTMSLDDLYNHLKVYEAKVQKKSNPNSQNMAFISSTKHSSGEEDGNTACVSTASTTFPTASASIDKDDMEEMDIKWSMTLLSMRAGKFWKRTRKKISIQGSDERGRKENYRQGSKAEENTPKALMAINGVGWDWSYMANEGEDHALVADAEAPTEFALMANTESK
nr:hypothetical protein [Tanacetum cinerariifolium]